MPKAEMSAAFTLSTAMAVAERAELSEIKLGNG